MTGTHETILDFSNHMGETFRGDDVQGFGARRDEVLLSTPEILSDNVLESLYQMRARESHQLKTVLALNEQEK